MQKVKKIGTLGGSQQYNQSSSKQQKLEVDLDAAESDILLGDFV